MCVCAVCRITMEPRSCWFCISIFWSLLWNAFLLYHQLSTAHNHLKRGTAFGKRHSRSMEQEREREKQCVLCVFCWLITVSKFHRTWTKTILSKLETFGYMLSRAIFASRSSRFMVDLLHAHTFISCVMCTYGWTCMCVREREIVRKINNKMAQNILSSGAVGNLSIFLDECNGHRWSGQLREQ